MEATEMRMSCKVMAALVAVVGLSLSASAEEKIFPSAGGDLASDAAWGGAKPTDADIAKIDKSGTYTLSDDVSFNRLTVATGGAVFNFGSRKMTSSASSAVGLSVSYEGGRTVFNGGVLDFSSTAHCYPLTACNDMTTVFTNGCIITNVVDFHAMRNTYRSRVEIAGGSKAYAKQLRVLNDPGADDVLEIYDGGQMHVSERIYSEANGTSGNYGGVVLRVRGAGSLFKFTGSNDAAVGFQRTGNTFHVVDGGVMNFSGTGSLLLGGWSYSDVRTNNALVVERSATASFPKIISNTDRNRIFVGSGATLTTAKLRLSSSMNEVIVSNATLTCTAPRNSTTASQEGFNLATSATCTGNVFRLIGPSASLSTLPWPLYWFNSSSYITFSIEGGAKWGDADNTHFDALFSKEQHCTFRVTGAGTVFGDAEGKNNRLYLCNKNAAVTETCASNVVEVSDGATLYASGIYMAGVGNALVVSNGTVNLKYLSIGELANDKTAETNVATNCMVRLCGTSPKISASGSYCKFQNNSVLRFEIPKAGYAANHVPVEMSGSGALTFDDTCRLEIDCEEFAQEGGATFTLIQTGSDITETVRNNLLSKLNNLPPRCSLIVSGRTVKLRCPRRGFVIKFY